MKSILTQKLKSQKRRKSSGKNREKDKTREEVTENLIVLLRENAVDGAGKWKSRLKTFKSWTYG